MALDELLECGALAHFCIVRSKENAMTRTASIALSLAAACVPSIAQAQQQEAPPKSAIYITDEEVKSALASQPPSTDRQLRVVDMGEYQLAVGIVHRGPTGAGVGGGRGGGAAGGGGGRGAGATAGVGRGAAPKPAPCGQTTGTPSGASGIAHDATTETYVITSGSGTLVTGGYILNGSRSAPESQVTRVLNGPSCSGQIAGGDVVKQRVKVGDVIIIPAGVPHGWIDIADHVDYLSVRPDPDEVLEKGYVHPAIKK
jgi:mannose-6-phosphate isomerase-like protein (cupin superfamily)